MKKKSKVDQFITQLPIFSSDRTEKFRKFHCIHPEVYSLFDQFTIRLIRKGFRRIGSRMIFERVRWELNTKNSEQKKLGINNNYASFYARMFVNIHPKHKQVFEFRKTNP